jgi:hypothetical protein
MELNMKLGSTGTRGELTGPQLIVASGYMANFFLEHTLSNSLGLPEFHHGLCIGSDATLHDIARELGYFIVGHPPIDQSRMADKTCDRLMPPLTHIKRNHVIVDTVDAMMGTPATEHEVLRSGTWSTIRYSMKTRKRILIIKPDGKMILHMFLKIGEDHAEDNSGT